MSFPCRTPLPHRQRGQAAVEFTVIGTLFLGILGGLIEMTYVSRAKHLLNMAVFDAARTGAINNATLAPMETTLENDMAALYMQSGVTQNDLSSAIGRATALYQLMKTNGASTTPVVAPLTIISPTLAIYNKFSETQMIRLASQSNEAAVNVIPNDNLQWRARTTQLITADGKSATINVQDANLLKIRVYWCQHLVVPGLDYIVHSIVDVQPTSQQQLCDTVANAPDNYYIAIESDAVMQMQDAVTYDGTNLH